MAGTTWNVFALGKKIKATQFNDNFDWAEGSLLPMNAGSTTTNVHDLGSDAARWRNLHLGTDAFIHGKIYLSTGAQILLGGTGSSYIAVDSSLATNRIRIVNANGVILNVDSSGIHVPEGIPLYLDGLATGVIGDTFIKSSTNTFIITAGNQEKFNITGSMTTIKTDVNIDGQLLLDKGLWFNDTSSGYIIHDTASSKMIFGYNDNPVLKITSDNAVDVLYDLRIYDQTSALYYWRFSHTINSSMNALDISPYQGAGTGASRFVFYGSGTGAADSAWVTFSPDIYKEEKYKNNLTITAEDYLSWSLEDAKKPSKPYNGIPHRKKKNETTSSYGVFETNESATAEKQKYSKDIAKMAIGTSRWAEWANNKIKELETKIQELQRV